MTGAFGPERTVMSNDTTSRDRARVPTGPEGVEWAGLIGRFATEDTVRVLERLRERHGPTVRIRPPVGDDDRILLTEPEHVEHVLERNRQNYPKADVYREELAEAFGSGLLTAEGERWARQNRTIAPMFQPRQIHRFGDLVLREADAMVDRWLEEDGPIDLLSETERVTLLIIGKAMFSEDLESRAAEIGEALDALRAGFQQRAGQLPSLPGWVPTPTVRWAYDALEFLDETVYELIKERRGQAGAYDDLLSRLLLAEDEETGRRMDDEQVRDEVMTFLLAGHETTAAALAWTWILLAEHPAVHRHLYEHVADSPLAAPEVSFNPSLLGELGCAKRVVQESMRLYPTVPVFARKAVETDVVGDVRVPAGTEVLLSQFLTHRDGRYWDDPEQFDPSRFADDDRSEAADGASGANRGNDERPRYAYFPFGGGPRACIGRSFALLEAQLILGRAVSRCRLELDAPASAADVGLNSAVTMTPEPEPEMTVYRRRDV